MSEVIVRHEGAKVLFIYNRRAVLEFPPEVAKTIAHGLLAHAGQAEMYERYHSGALVKDQEALYRAGLGLALTKNQHVIEQAARAAGGIPSSGIVGIPTLHKKRPKRMVSR